MDVDFDIDHELYGIMNQREPFLEHLVREERG